MLSVVVLCYRSEDKIISFLDNLQSILQEERIKYELVLVGNYYEKKNDKTPEIIKNYSRKFENIVTVTKKKEGGMGWDAISGFDNCSGDSIAFIDGDGQFPSSDIIRIYRKFKTGKYDFIKTFREIRHDGRFRIVQSSLFNFLFKILFPLTSFKDINSKPKIFSLRSYKKMQLKCKGWFLDGELILEVSRMKLKYLEIPTVFQKNEFRGSFVNLSAILEMIKDLIKYRVIYLFKK